MAGRGESWLHPLQSLRHCMHLSSPGLTLPSYQVLNHWFKPWLSISATALLWKRLDLILETKWRNSMHSNTECTLSLCRGSDHNLWSQLTTTEKLRPFIPSLPEKKKKKRPFPTGNCPVTKTKSKLTFSFCSWCIDGCILAYKNSHRSMIIKEL